MLIDSVIGSLISIQLVLDWFIEGDDLWNIMTIKLNFLLL